MTETPKISAPDLLARYQQGQTPGRNFVVVDLRSTDFAGGTVKGSLNIPMQTLEYGIPALYSLVRAARIDEVIFFCGWFAALFSLPHHPRCHIPPASVLKSY